MRFHLIFTSPFFFSHSSVVNYYKLALTFNHSFQVVSDSIDDHAFSCCVERATSREITVIKTIFSAKEKKIEGKMKKKKNYNNTDVDGIKR